MKKLTLLDVKQAIWDERFRNLFPELKEELDGFLKDPGCPCNITLYNKIIQYKDRLKQYFPTKEISFEESPSKWKVINCHISELEGKLKKLDKNPKQIAVARYEDQVTVIVNDIFS